MSSFTIQKGTGVFYLPLEFQLEHGGVLVASQLAFERTGPEDAPVIVVLGGISAGMDVVGWWSDIVGPGLAIDTSTHCVLGIDFLGGAGASTGPSNWQGEGSFPLITSRDQARAIARLLDHLGVERLHRFVGSSYGGMVGLAFAAEYSERLEGLIAIGAAHESHPMALAWRSLQRRIVRFGKSHGDERTAVALARGLAITTYRSHEEFGQRFDSAPSDINGCAHFPVEEYLDARGNDFADHFTSDEYLALSQAIDLHRVDPADVRVPTLLIGFESDQLVPIPQLEDLAERLGQWGKLIALPSLFGHDGFLKEVDALRPILQKAIADPRGEVA